MALVDRGDGSHGPTPSGLARRNFEPLRRWLLCAVPLAEVLATVVAPSPAFAQGCTGLCAAQTMDQAGLLSNFGTLLNTPAGRAALSANLAIDESIYLNSSPAQKVAAAEDALFQYAPINILITAFPTNPNFYYTPAGIPTAPGLPSAVTTAVSSIFNNVGLGLKDYFGQPGNVYGNAYGNLVADPNGNPRPFQVSALIASIPFSVRKSSVIAVGIQQTAFALGNGFANENWQSYTLSPAFPSRHSTFGNMTALFYGILAPGYYQQFAQAGVDFAYGRNVFGVHYPLDVIGGRIDATYVLAETLAGNPLYPGGATILANLASLSQTFQGYLGGGNGSPYVAQCAGRVAACVAGGVIPSAAAYAQMAQKYTAFLTYGLPSTGDTTLAPVVPADAHWLIATRFPYLGPPQLDQILATTELPSGGALDIGTGWARLNLYAAAGGYGAFPTNVTVDMNAKLGGLNAFDVWSNPISGPGGLTLQGSGTLILAGNNSYTGDTVVQGGTLGITGTVAGNVAVWAGANLAGNGVVAGSLALLPRSIYQAGIGPNGASLLQVGGTVTLSGGTLAVGSFGDAAALGSAWPILTAAGGINGSFGSLTEPTIGLAPGTRFDALYGSNVVSLLVTPSYYSNLSAAGVTQSSSERGVGAALDAIRPAPGVAMDPTEAALFDPLYALPAGSITVALDELAPTIYPDTMITGRNSWYLMADAVSAQLATRRGVAADHAANSAPGPDGSTIWVTGFGGYDSVGAGGGSPGFTAGLGGTAAGIDVPVAGTGRIGVAVGTVEGQTWSQSDGNATSSTAQLVTYGQWQSGMFFAEAQLGLMYQQETAHRPLPLFGVTMRGTTNGQAGGGGVRIGMQQYLDGWLIEPSLAFGGFDLHLNGLTETGGGALAETIGGATLGSAAITLSVGAQRGFAVSETVRLVVKGRLGWSHEFADNVARVSASFADLSGSGFALTSAPIGRDAALVGLGADIKVASWPVAMFIDYGGAISGSSNAQSFNAGLRFTW